ncbi:MAG: antirestriction protein [Limnobacter sp.]|jgi:hypothetical protein
MESKVVVATKVEEKDGATFIQNKFGVLAPSAELRVFSFMSWLAPAYRGGVWEFYDLSNGGMYMAPKTGPLRIEVPTNGFEGTLSADAAGIVATLFALCYLCETRDDERCIDYYHALREFASEHGEISLIFSAID